MKAAAEPCSAVNDAALLQMATRTIDSGGIIICAWGTHGKHRGRGDQVRKLLDGFPLHYLRLTQGGFPEHPLYIGYEVKPVRWEV